MSPAGFEPTTYGLKVREYSTNSSGNTNFGKQGAAESAAFQSGNTDRNRVADPDLQLVIERWEDLPNAVKAGIVAMIRAAKTD